MMKRLFVFNSVYPSTISEVMYADTCLFAMYYLNSDLSSPPAHEGTTLKYINKFVALMCYI